MRNNARARAFSPGPRVFISALTTTRSNPENIPPLCADTPIRGYCLVATEFNRHGIERLLNNSALTGWRHSSVHVD